MTARVGAGGLAGSYTPPEVEMARMVLDHCNIGDEQDFHALTPLQRGALASWAAFCRYRRPRGAGMSRSYYFLMHLRKVASR